VTVLGFDIAGDVQGALTDADWAKIALVKRFVIIQARQGNDFDTPRFAEYNAGAQAAGVTRGAYLFCEVLPDDGVHLGRDPESQVQAFFEASGGLGGAAGELPPSLDVESPPPERWGADGVSAAFCEEWTGRAIARVKSLWGVLPMVYGYLWWFQQAKLVTAAQCPLWLANYGGATYRTAPPWPRATMLQTGNGAGPSAYHLPNGQPVDENEVGDGDFAALLARP
jgi:GH25 family lysozyme M1 (1,4-beta-N-acetylmuramidase)